MSRAVQLPAPGRGGYDRRLTSAERQAEHRERILLATSQVSSEGALTVARIVERAGVGRSTFYEFFDSPEHVVEQLEQRTLRTLGAALDRAFGDARTPLERLRALMRSWTNIISSQPDALRAVLARKSSRALSPAGEELQRALQRCVELGRTEAGWFKSADELTVLAAAASIEALSRRHLSARVEDLPKILSELLVKLLR